MKKSNDDFKSSVDELLKVKLENVGKEGLILQKIVTVIKNKLDHKDIQVAAHK